MGVKFAGSRALDDRRRRRLASEQDPEQISQSATARHPGFASIRRPNDQTSQKACSPIGSLIPAKSISIWLWSISLPLVLSLLIVGVHLLSLQDEGLLRSSLDFRVGATWRFLTSTLLGLSALACWLVSWFRSANVRDFDGCFKSWYWSGWVFSLFAVSAGCELHLIFSRYVADYAMIEIPVLRSSLWVVPATALLVEPVRAFVREMWHCRRSWIALHACNVSAVVYLAAVVVEQQFPLLLEPDVCLVFITLTSVLTPALMVSALLSQTHYVMYVSSDAVQKRKSTLVRIFTISGAYLFERLRFVTRMFGSGSKSTREDRNKRREERAKQREERAKQKAEEQERRRQERADKLAAEKQRAEELKAEKMKAKELQAEKERAKSAEKEQQQSQRQSKRQARKARREAAKVASPAPENNTENVEREHAATADRSTQQNQTAEKQADKRPSDANQSTPQNKPRIRVKTGSSANPEPDAETSKNNAEQSSQSKTPQKNQKSKQRATVPMSEADADDRLDPEALKGLSKKERRRLRKLHREEQRRKAG